MYPGICPKELNAKKVRKTSARVDNKAEDVANMK
jgi:hypothetical protein